jgi:hypothetical protein
VASEAEASEVVGGTEQTVTTQEETDVVQGQGVVEQRRRCYVCGGNLRRGVWFAECVQCGRQVHAACRGGNRYRRDRQQQYTCDQCLGAGSSASSVQTPTLVTASLATEVGNAITAVQPTLPPGKCDECGSQRRVGLGLRCKTCHKMMHQKCTGVKSRVALKKMLQQGSWECEACKEEVVLESQNR